MQVPQYNLEKEDGASTLRDDFFSRIHSFIFTSIAPELWNLSNKANQFFPVLSLQCLVGHIQAWKIALVFATNQIANHT